MAETAQRNGKAKTEDKTQDKTENKTADLERRIGELERELEEQRALAEDFRRQLRLYAERDAYRDEVARLSGGGDG